jgi:hypothetical protein
MRRLIALLVLWTALLGAGSPAFACVTAAAAGDCCPPGAPSGCSQTYEQLDVVATICCITAPAPSQMVSVESGRERHVLQLDRGSPDPIVVVSKSDTLSEFQQRSHFTTPLVSSASTDASLTYLHTGRLRL